MRQKKTGSQRPTLPGAVVQLYVQHAWHLSVLLLGPPVHGRNSHRRFITLPVTESLDRPVESTSKFKVELSAGLLFFPSPELPVLLCSSPLVSSTSSIFPVYTFYYCQRNL